MADFVDDLIKHAISRSGRHIADALALIDDERDATRLIIGFGARSVGHLCEQLADERSPFPIFRSLSRSAQVHVLMSIYINATGEDLRALDSVQAQSDMLAAIMEVLGHENRKSGMVARPHR